MYTLERVYGKVSYETWEGNPQADDLSLTRSTPEQALRDEWEVNSFTELLERVAFLGAMNKRLVLYYRGQTSAHSPICALFRPSWICFGENNVRLSITAANRLAYWKALEEIGEQVYKICKSMGLPRWRGLRDIREAQWAIVQHYGIWPTPLLDLTLSLRVAARFAFPFMGSAKSCGYIFVVGLPDTNGSITADVDQHIVLARLQNVCPPVAKRPHYQEGFLVGRFPFHSPEQFEDDKQRDKLNLTRRLIALFKLVDRGGFWDSDFPIMNEASVYPANDPLLARFNEVFGHGGGHSVLERARKFSSVI
jgi:hypothetical protein